MIKSHKMPCNDNKRPNFVGADPEVVNAYVGSGSSDWFTDLERTEELLVG